MLFSSFSSMHVHGDVILQIWEEEKKKMIAATVFIFYYYCYFFPLLLPFFSCSFITLLEVFFCFNRILSAHYLSTFFLFVCFIRKSSEMNKTEVFFSYCCTANSALDGRVNDNKKVKGDAFLFFIFFVSRRQVRSHFSCKHKSTQRPTSTSMLYEREGER